MRRGKGKRKDEKERVREKRQEEKLIKLQVLPPLAHKRFLLKTTLKYTHHIFISV